MRDVYDADMGKKVAEYNAVSIVVEEMESCGEYVEAAELNERKNALSAEITAFFIENCTEYYIK